MFGFLFSVPTESMTEAALLDDCIHRLAVGDMAAMDVLYRRTNAGIYAYALSVLKNTHDAEDVLQECYIKVYDNAASYRSQGKPMAWLITVAKNLCYGKLRQAGHYGEVDEKHWEFLSDDGDGLTAEDRMTLTQCMMELSDEEREIVVMHAVSGMKHREIAAVLQMALPTVLSKYNRALKKLRQKIE